MTIDHKYESSRTACRRFWQGQRERLHYEGATAPPGARCPYPPTSFAALHWQHGANERDT